MPKLNNLKQEMFANEFIKDRNGTRAYSEAYKCENLNSAGVSAKRLLRNDKILARIDELQKPILEKCKIDTEWIIKKHKELINYGTEKDEDGEMRDTVCTNKSLDALAKIKGSYSADKLDINAKFEVDMAILEARKRVKK